MLMVTDYQFDCIQNFLEYKSLIQDRCLVAKYRIEIKQTKIFKIVFILNDLTTKFQLIYNFPQENRYVDCTDSGVQNSKSVSPSQ